MLPWRRGPILINPYYRTAFRVAGIPREMTRRRTLVTRIGERRRIVKSDPTVICGEPVTDAEINRAEKILLDAEQRILEELLVHATERPPLERFRELALKATALMQDEPGILTVTDAALFRPWLIQEVTRWLNAHPGPDPSFGALELQLTPPFGDAEET